jgi:predicted permease
MRSPRSATPARPFGEELAPPALPALPAALLRLLLPPAERDELLADFAEEFAAHRGAGGDRAARRWLWGQVLGSAPALVRWSWWRGWSGFEPRANWTRPGGPMLKSWITDVRYAARRLRSRPVYALLAVLTLALGVGGTAAVSGIARSLLFEPLPYAREEEVGLFWMPFDWTEEEILYLRGRIPGFREVAGFRPEDVTMQVGTAPTRLVPGVASSAELFSVLGARPLLGRAFQRGDDAQGAEPVAVISYGLWQELGGEESILGRRLTLDGAARTVVGVMPRGFWFPSPAVRVWTPQPLDPEQRSGNYALVGRAAPGQRLDAMGAPLARLTAILGERFDYPEQWDKTRSPAVTPVRDYMMGPIRPALLATLAAMGLILLIACANVAALMLGQVDAQSSELAVRSALGANRGRLTQQLVVEALVVGAASAAVGAALAALAFRLLVWALPLGAWAESAALDWTVFGSAIGLALLSAMLVVLVPTVSLWRGDLRGALGRARTGGVGGRGGRLEGGLVVAEVALAVLIAAGAALLVRSVSNLYAIDPGVKADNVAVLDVVTPADLTRERRQQTIGELVAAVAALPGVERAAATHKLPLRGSGSSTGIRVEGRPDVTGTTTFFRLVSPDYFETVGIALRDGRTFAASDLAAGERVVVVNQALVDKYFAGVNPIGQRVNGPFGGWERIVGVVANVAEGALTDEPEPARYSLYSQTPWVSEQQTLVIRSRRPGDPAALLDEARRAVQRAAPGVAVSEATTMRRVVDAAVGPAREIMALLMLLTALALVLGAVGIYGVISHFATSRKRDWAIRLARRAARRRPRRAARHGRDRARRRRGRRAGAAPRLAALRRERGGPARPRRRERRAARRGARRRLRAGAPRGAHEPGGHAARTVRRAAMPPAELRARRAAPDSDTRRP